MSCHLLVVCTGHAHISFLCPLKRTYFGKWERKSIQNSRILAYSSLATSQLSACCPRCLISNLTFFSVGKNKAIVQHHGPPITIQDLSSQPREGMSMYAWYMCSLQGLCLEERCSGNGVMWCNALFGILSDTYCILFLPLYPLRLIDRNPSCSSLLSVLYDIMLVDGPFFCCCDEHTLLLTYIIYLSMIYRTSLER